MSRLCLYYVCTMFILCLYYVENADTSAIKETISVNFL